MAIAGHQTLAKKILRLHSYEAYTDLLPQIDLEAFDAIVFVASHVKRYVLERLQYTPFDNQVHIIPNGADLTRFRIAPGKQKNKKIAYAGYVSNKKGAIMLLALANQFREYEFHIAGKFQERDIQYLFKEKNPGNIYDHGWTNDLNAFFADKTYILNCSPREGMPVALLEGMAAGLQPLIYDWVGADNYFKRDYIWKNFAQLRKMLGTPYNPDQYRTYIEGAFSQATMVSKYMQLVQSLIEVDENGNSSEEDQKS